MTLHINCSDPWFSLLENGIKPVEGRKAQEKYTSLKPGDEVCFHCTNCDKSFNAIIERVDKFKTLIEYLNGVSLEKALPGIKNLEEGIKIYSEWSAWEEIDKMGFVGIWIIRK
jgi:ASC-1-like (ASCH) protein